MEGNIMYQNLLRYGVAGLLAVTSVLVWADDNGTSSSRKGVAPAVTAALKLSVAPPAVCSAEAIKKDEICLDPAAKVAPQTVGENAGAVSSKTQLRYETARVMAGSKRTCVPYSP
jgi:hypothetical protein